MIISAAELLGRAKTNPIDNHRPAFFVDKFAAQPTTPPSYQRKPAPRMHVACKKRRQKLSAAAR
jgi:hypothetical protein